MTLTREKFIERYRDELTGVLLRGFTVADQALIAAEAEANRRDTRQYAAWGKGLSDAGRAVHRLLGRIYDETIAPPVSPANGEAQHNTPAKAKG